MSSACAVESSGRIVAGVVIGLLSSVFLVIFMLEYLQRPTLDIPASNLHEDTPLLLLWADMTALAAGFVSAFLLLLPELCCETRDEDDPTCREDFRRERNTASLVLVITVVVFSVTARIRDVNVKTSMDDHHVCGARTSIYACPTQRAMLSEDYVDFLNVETTCWFNTTAEASSQFTWGADLKNASVYPTSDFSLKDTYVSYPEYANCFYWGCGGPLCNPEMFAHQEIMLKLEIAVAVLFVGLVLVSMCVSVPEVQYANILPVDEVMTM